VTRSCIYHSVVYIHGRIALANATDELTLADARQLPSRKQIDWSYRQLDAGMV